MSKLFNCVDKKNSIQVPLWIFMGLPFFAYLFWEGYWYTIVGLRVIKWHTHLVEYVYVWILGWFIFRLFKKSDSEKIKNAFLLFTSIVFSLAVLEIFLQVSGMYKTNMEKISGEYSSPYAPQENTYYHVWPPGKPHWITKPEFSYLQPTNSLGFPDIEWKIPKKSGEKRLLALGDSFTEGDGAPHDSSYVALLKTKLLVAGDSFYVMNAGVCGSDPFNNYVILKDKLLIYQPDIVIQALSSYDLLTDIMTRGGAERFQNDGTVKYRPAPWWEPFYALSYISRIFFRRAGYDELLRKGDITADEEKNLNKWITDLFKQYAAFCRENNIRLFIILRPEKCEIEKNQYMYGFSPLLRELQSDKTITVVNLLPSYKKYIENNHAQSEQYFWKYDGHHNAKGYEMMAQTIFENLSSFIEDSTIKENK